MNFCENEKNKKIILAQISIILAFPQWSIYSS